MRAPHQIHTHHRSATTIGLISRHLRRSIPGMGGCEMVPSMDLLKALFSFCLERFNWLKQIPDILMPLCQSKLQSDIAVFISCINGSAMQYGPVFVSYT